jgi:gliding motility-associated protein GldM
MINLMYLVLTALLALNVSSEILNAFRTVNNSLNHATATIEGKNQNLFRSLQELLKDPKTRDSAMKWAPKAEQAKKISDDMYSYIGGLQEKLKREAGFAPEKGDSSFKEDDLDAATRLMDKGGEGKNLQQKLERFKADLLGIDPQIGAFFKNSLPIDLTMPEVRDETNNTWSAAYFRMTPTIAAITILSKFQNDVKNSEAQIVEYCHNKIGRVQVVYNEFQAFAGTNSQYLMPGQELQITAGVGAFSKEAKPTVTIDGSTVGLNAEGVAEYKSIVGGPGTYTKRVKISFVKPDGSVGTVEKDIQYTVGSPTGATVSADAVKVLYIGLDNPLSVSGGNVGDEKVSARMDNGSLTKTGAGKYIARPGRPGKANITLDIQGGKPQTFEFRVKTVPDPQAMVGASKGGPMRANDFKAQAGVRAELENFVFEGVQFTVTGYTIVFQAAGFEQGLQFRQVGGNTFNSVRDLIERCKPGTAVTIDEIKVSGPGGRRQLPPIQFNLR